MANLKILSGVLFLSFVFLLNTNKKGLNGDRPSLSLALTWHEDICSQWVKMCPTYGILIVNFSFVGHWFFCLSSHSSKWETDTWVFNLAGGMVLLWKSGRKGLITKLSFHEEYALLLFFTTWRILKEAIFVSRIQTSTENEVKEWGSELGKRTEAAVNLHGSLQFLVFSAVKNWHCTFVYLLCHKVMISQNEIIFITVLSKF